MMLGERNFFALIRRWCLVLIHMKAINIQFCLNKEGPPTSRYIYLNCDSQSLEVLSH